MLILRFVLCVHTILDLSRHHLNVSIQLFHPKGLYPRLILLNSSLTGECGVLLIRYKTKEYVDLVMHLVQLRRLKRVML